MCVCVCEDLPSRQTRVGQRSWTSLASLNSGCLIRAQPSSHQDVCRLLEPRQSPELGKSPRKNDKNGGKQPRISARRIAEANTDNLRGNEERR